MTAPLITVVIPSFNQGKYLNDAIASIFQQEIPVEVFIIDGGSTDNSLKVIYNWKNKISGWRSYPDDGQAAAINEGIALGSAPYVCWLNSDDWLLPNSLTKLLNEILKYPNTCAVYGRAWNIIQKTGKKTPVWVEPFSEERLAMRCIISQPATLIRRSAWENINGVDSKLHLAMDYDLWWRLFKEFGPLKFLNEFVAVNREHEGTKTRNFRRRHYKEAMHVVQKYHGRLPLKWWLIQPYSVWFKSIIG